MESFIRGRDGPHTHTVRCHPHTARVNGGNQQSPSSAEDVIHTRRVSRPARAWIIHSASAAWFVQKRSQISFVVLMREAIRPTISFVVLMREAIRPTISFVVLMREAIGGHQTNDQFRRPAAPSTVMSSVRMRRWVRHV